MPEGDTTDPAPIPRAHGPGAPPWSLTVAAIIERQGRFLLVEETDGVHPERVLNQPAGHVDPGESPVEAVIRETREETGLAFVPERIVGLYPLQARNGRDYFRVCFAGGVEEGREPHPEDPEILACHWLSLEELARRPLRSGLVLRCIQDYLAGCAIPLERLAEPLRER